MLDMLRNGYVADVVCDSVVAFLEWRSRHDNNQSACCLTKKFSNNMMSEKATPVYYKGNANEWVI